jgi:hypothetical protein
VEDGGRHVVELLHEALAGGDRFAEDGVNERADGGFAGLDGFVDGGVVGDVEDEDLAEADAEDIAGVGVELAVAEFADPMVEDASVAEDTEQDGLEEGAVCGGKHATLRVALDEAFRVIMSLRPGAEGGYGGLADVEIFGRHVEKREILNSKS